MVSEKITFPFTDINDEWDEGPKTAAHESGVLLQLIDIAIDII